MDISELADLINDETTEQMFKDSGISNIEALEGNVIDNTDTFKKIEDKRKFVTIDNQAARSSGLGSASISQSRPASKSQTQSSAQTSSSWRPSYSGVPGGIYAPRVVLTKEQILHKKAREFSEAMVGDIDEKLKQKQKSNWNIFDLEEAELEKKGEIKKVLNTRSKKAMKVEMFILNILAYGIKALVEVTYKDMAKTINKK